MSCYSKKELEQMLEDVVNEFDLSEIAIAEHGPSGTPPSQLVRLVLDQKDKTIRMLQAGMVDVRAAEEIVHLRKHIQADYDQYYDHHPYAHELRTQYPWLATAETAGKGEMVDVRAAEVAEGGK